MRVPSGGSSTILLTQLIEDKVCTASVGDVGYLWLRKRGLDLIVEHESSRKEHGFDRPFALGQGGDDPALAVVHSHDV